MRVSDTDFLLSSWSILSTYNTSYSFSVIWTECATHYLSWRGHRRNPKAHFTICQVLSLKMYLIESQLFGRIMRRTICFRQCEEFQETWSCNRHHCSSHRSLCRRYREPVGNSVHWYISVSDYMHVSDTDFLLSSWSILSTQNTSYWFSVIWTECATH